MAILHSRLVYIRPAADPRIPRDAVLPADADPIRSRTPDGPDGYTRIQIYGGNKNEQDPY